MRRQFFVFNSKSFWRGFSNGLCLFVARKNTFSPVCNDLKLKPLRPIVNNSTEAIGRAWSQMGKNLEFAIDQFSKKNGESIKNLP